MLSLQKVKFPSLGWPVQPLAFVGENALNRILAALMPPPGTATKFGSSVPTSFPSYLLNLHDPNESFAQRRMKVRPRAGLPSHDGDKPFFLLKPFGSLGSG